MSTAQVLLQSDRIKFAVELPEITMLVSELLSFEVKFSEAGTDTYGAWREGAHDDLVFAVALAALYAQNFGHPPEKPRRIVFRGW